MDDILEYYGGIHAGYLHAKGKPATGLLVQMLDCRPGEKILEIGFGTGATLVQLAAAYKGTEIHGAERSLLMYQKAKGRLAFALLSSKVKLCVMEAGRLPYPDQSFDKVFLESVLGIQEGGDLESMLAEIHRVLRPGGVLLMNETLWLDSTPPARIKKTNEDSKKAFGIIQASGEYPYPGDWISLLKKNNFQVDSILKPDEIQEAPYTRFPFIHRLLSNVFTGWGKIRSRLKGSLRKKRALFEKSMKEINPDQSRLMEGVIFKATRLI